MIRGIEGRKCLNPLDLICSGVSEIHIQMSSILLRSILTDEEYDVFLLCTYVLMVSCVGTKLKS